MEFLPESIDQYVHNHTKAESDLLARLNRETHVKIMSPRMLSGHLQGRVLSLLAKLHRPKRILEIGTYTGYSALCLAEGLVNGGELHTIDINEELEDFARKYFDESDFGDSIHQHIGKALDVIPTLKDGWDIVFIDADKSNYVNYYNDIVPRMNPGGLILCDNVLWSGKIVDENANDKDTVVLRELNELITQDDRVENVLLPIRDGLMAARIK
ncbi:O-methyltransferase [Phaeocystidibacter marisrubri]|uniref:O-methyltransferase n=1 Tax=Phaeocystidibacter marisrubri TaxID=1577780 RepID=A0A6L3ZE84_9FLAO|nr:O-methyltransferase [Phaeocystidibacter marisrubri]KAB2815908.1 O-methyltransferase [Phaeocystidibacter marisrubri]GGH66340.1 O-methyltransferase [Phaeocystidibacter marisrubri]